MKTILNIGLNKSDGGVLDLRDVLRQIGGSYPDSVTVWPSPNGDAVVVVVVVELDDADNAIVHNLAAILSQDCIATWNGEIGELVGPKAEAWGEFNPRFFVLPDGSTLAPGDSFHFHCFGQSGRAVERGETKNDLIVFENNGLVCCAEIKIVTSREGLTDEEAVERALADYSDEYESDDEDDEDEY